MSLPCPTNCGRTLPCAHIMCPKCWRLVPLDMRREARVAQRQLESAYQRDFDARAIGTLRREVEEAKRLAIDYVKERIHQMELSL